VKAATRLRGARRRDFGEPLEGIGERLARRRLILRAYCRRRRRRDAARDVRELKVETERS